MIRIGFTANIDRINIASIVYSITSISIATIRSDIMKALLFVAGLFFCINTTYALGNTPLGNTTQQDKMKSCNADAATKQLKGDERKKFMSNCLKAPALTTQQNKMKTCNADATAKNLKGDARKTFMSNCLKADAPNTQQNKMVTCNADASAKNLKGDARKAFMKSCLSS
jgi:hypothetical protein